MRCREAPTYKRLAFRAAQREARAVADGRARGGVQFNGSCEQLPPLGGVLDHHQLRGAHQGRHAEQHARSGCRRHIGPGRPQTIAERKCRDPPIVALRHARQQLVRVLPRDSVGDQSLRTELA